MNPVGYHNNYPPLVDAYGRNRYWAGSRAAFVGEHSYPGVGGLGAAEPFYRIADATEGHQLSVALAEQSSAGRRLAARLASMDASGLIGQQPAAEEPKSNTLLYVGLGVAAVAVLGLVVLARR